MDNKIDTQAHKLVLGDLFCECYACHSGVNSTDDVEPTPAETKSARGKLSNMFITSAGAVDSADVGESTPLSTKQPKRAYPT